MRRCSQVRFFFNLFPFLFCSLTAPVFLHIFLLLVPLPRVASPPVSLAPSFPLRLNLRPLALGHPPSPAWAWDVMRRLLTSHSEMRPTLDGAFLVRLFFLLSFSFFADRFPSLLSAHRGPFCLQMRVGASSFLKSARAAPGLSSLFYFFFPADRFLSSQVHWNPLLFTNAGGSPSSRICMCCISAYEREV